MFIFNKQVALGAIVLAIAGASVQASIIFEDDFDDGVIDPSKWVASPNGNGGAVNEINGYQQVILSDPSPYQQLRTSVDLMQNSVSIQARLTPVSVAGNKNIGFYLGETPDDPTYLNGFVWFFNSTANRIIIQHVTGAFEESPGRWGYTQDWGWDSRDLWGIDQGVYHVYEIRKEGDLYSFYRDGELGTSWLDTGNGPSELFWTAGVLWNYPRDGETGELRTDWIMAIPEPVTLSLLALGSMTLLRRRRCP